MQIEFKAHVSESGVTLRPQSPFDGSHAFTFPKESSDETKTLIEDFYQYNLELLRERLDQLKNQ